MAKCCQHSVTLLPSRVKVGKQSRWWASLVPRPSARVKKKRAGRGSGDETGGGKEV